MAPIPSKIANPVPEPSTINNVFHALTENNIIQWLVFGFGLPTSLWIFYKVLERVLAIHSSPSMINEEPRILNLPASPVNIDSSNENAFPVTHQGNDHPNTNYDRSNGDESTQNEDYNHAEQNENDDSNPREGESDITATGAPE